MPRISLAAVVAAVTLAAPAVAHAAPGSGPTAVVSLGDSYISGQAGRWQGNSINPVPPHDRTDRGRGAYVGGSDANNCHRSDVAEVMSARVPVDARVNLACSGSTTSDIFRASAGGRGEKGESPQADQLLAVARTHDVRMVVLSIGGNDLGFADVVIACITAYAAKGAPCRQTEAAGLHARIPQAREGVARAIDEIRIVMAEAGYRPADYRLVVQTYPSVVPRSREARYAEATQERSAHGCPFYDTDLDWARDEVVPLIAGMIRTAAAARGAEILDLGDALQGHEVCSRSAAQVTAFGDPGRTGGEWGRFAAPSTVQQGEVEEAFHPNAYGQIALGDCLARVYAAGAPGTFDCDGAGGRDADAMALERTSTLPGARVRRAAPRLRLAVRRRRGCVLFRVTAGGVPVKGARIRYAGRRLRTGRRGVARDCRRLAERRYRVTARRAGYRPARAVVRRP